MKKSRVLIIALMIAAVAGYFVYQYVNKNEEGLDSVKADYTLSCDSIYQEFKVGKDQASQKYLGKTILISGEVGSVETAGKNVTVVYKISSGDAIVRCALDSVNAPKLKTAQGQKLTLKGEYVGFEDDLMFVSVPEVNFNRCVIIEK